MHVAAFARRRTGLSHDRSAGSFAASLRFARKSLRAPRTCSEPAGGASTASFAGRVVRGVSARAWDRVALGTRDGALAI